MTRPKLEVLWALGALLGCSEGAAGSSSDPPHDEPDGGSTECLPGEATLQDGSCQPAGIPADACGPGFESDDNGSCRAVLPAEPCADGSMATPGETACRAVAPCGEGVWGTIAIEDGAQFVDAAYAGSDSDGTQQRPWTTLQAGIDAADAGALVAVAAGSYAEDIQITTPGLRVRGRCPELVEIVGAGVATVAFIQGGSGSELHDVAVRGAGNGIIVSGAENVLVERVWVHDTAGRGVALQDSFGATSATVRGALIEDVNRYAVFAVAATVGVEASVLRRITPDDEPWGLGIIVQDGALTLRSSLIHDGVGVGVYLDETSATIEGSVIRDTQRDPTTSVGRSLEVHSAKPPGERPPFALSMSLVERSHGIGVLVAGVDASFDRLIVRDTVDDDDEAHGRALEAHETNGGGARVGMTQSVIEANHDGFNVAASELSATQCIVRDQTPNVHGSGGRGATVANTGSVRGVLEFHDSVLERNHEYAILGIGSDVLLEHSVVRDTMAADGIESGLGLAIQRDPEAAMRGSATVQRSLFERNTAASILGGSSDVVVERTTLRDTRPAADGRLGRAIHVQQEFVLDIEPSNLTLRQVTIEQAVEFGVMINASNAIIDDTVVRGVVANIDQDYGDGIAVTSVEQVGGTLQLRRSHIVGAARAGVTMFGGTTSLADTVFECNPIDLDGESYFGADYAVQDEGGNVCGCDGETRSCAVTTSLLAPPPPP